MWDLIWDSRGTSLRPDRDRKRADIATGNKGQAVRLRRSADAATRGRTAGDGVHQERARPDVFTTANPGKLFACLRSARARTCKSKRADARHLGLDSVARQIPKDSKIELSTRSGNTETPDETWSAWSSPYTTPEGSAITSPKARYIQWRAVLTGKGDGPVLTSINAAYLQRNLRPVVRSITVHPPGIVFQKPFTTGEPELAGFGDQTTPDRKLTNAAQTPQGQSSGLGRRTFQKNLQTFVWRADDENDDDLVYDVLYRREARPSGRRPPERRRVDLRVGYDDGAKRHAFLRVVASDSPSNPAGTALAGERDSGAFQIDHTPPRLPSAASARTAERRRCRLSTDADFLRLARGILARRRPEVDRGLSCGRDCGFEERALRAHARGPARRERRHDPRVRLDE